MIAGGARGKRLEQQGKRMIAAGLYSAAGHVVPLIILVRLQVLEESATDHLKSEIMIPLTEQLRVTADLENSMITLWRPQSNPRGLGQ